MLDRRKKKRLYERQAEQEQQHAEDGGTNDNDDDQQQWLTATNKRPHEALHNDSSSGRNHKKIIIPAGLSAKEAKKFRKDARRQARAEGRDDAQLVFVVEGQELTDAATNIIINNNNSTNKRRKTHHNFPNLNELAAQQKRDKERQQEEATRLQSEATLDDTVKARYIALDCEMVGTGSSGKRSALARASLVDWDGRVLLDSFVQVPTRVTDFRTQYSGVLPKHLRSQKAISLEECRQKVTELLKDKILVGHALSNDLDALLLTHPKTDIRDTAKYRPYQRHGKDGKYRPRKLRDLVAEHCDLIIQREGEAHDSVDDARATMELFKRARVAWEAALRRKHKKDV